MIDKYSGSQEENIRTWASHIISLLSDGYYENPRGISCMETLAPDSISFWTRAPIINPMSRDIGTRFMAAEAAWIFEGNNRLERIGKYAPLHRYSDDGVTLAGAYGPPITNQMDYIRRTLTRDRSSRQAVLTIWKSHPRASKDIPCTVSVQFLIRQEKMYTIVNMRSSDIWLGLPYDFFTFSMLSGWIAAQLECDVGETIFQIGSLHIYEKDIPKFGTMMALPDRRIADWDHFRLGDMSLLEFSEYLWLIADGEADYGCLEELNEINKQKRAAKKQPAN